MKRVALIGPTAGGKSALAMAAARARPSFELVSVDAMQVYRGMDIGTAKPTAEERREIRHHGIDLVDPSDEFTVADFVNSVRASLADIERRGRDALLVGGTGLYLRAIIDELQLPGRWPDIRDELERAATVDLGPLFDRLRTLDPIAADKMEPTNARRIVRALEVCLGSGRPFSSFGPGLEAYPPIATIQLGLAWDRAVLSRRIARRVQTMMSEGLLDETRDLLDRHPLSRTARQALGYRELVDHLEGRCSLAEAVETIELRTRQFAVRQDRWFRRDPRIRWIPIGEEPVAEGLPSVLEALDT